MAVLKRKVVRDGESFEEDHVHKREKEAMGVSTDLSMRGMCIFPRYYIINGKGLCTRGASR